MQINYNINKLQARAHLLQSLSCIHNCLPLFNIGIIISSSEISVDVHSEFSTASEADGWVVLSLSVASAATSFLTAALEVAGDLVAGEDLIGERDFDGDWLRDLFFC